MWVEIIQKKINLMKFLTFHKQNKRKKRERHQNEIKNNFRRHKTKGIIHKKM